ncbi:hypothetical protein QFC22_002926 [Naganishia vaughanmartiniae]|uniref:Uncharacterized protein n=1 Tax=Naganishia vaughanmartiniae TaxID=1424756 RepID=A0ACC2X9H8_9TREE|nr:hypothetical protein QFC22_002926 [Naganishia vaughanmartiniae]
MDAAQESKTKPDEAMPASASALPAEGKADAPAAVEVSKANPSQPKRDANAVPKPQLGMPQFRNRPQAIPFDSQSEFTGRCEDWLLIPAKKYPLINWRFLFGGDGQKLSPLTLIERETGAAILVRNMKRTVNRRPPGASGMGGAGFAEVQRFQEALAALQRAEREAAINVVAADGNGRGTNEAIRGGDSNAGIPPTPKNELVEGGGKQLPAEGMALGALPNLLLTDTAVTTPTPSSPAEDKKQLPAAEEDKAAALPVLKEEDEAKDYAEKKAEAPEDDKKDVIVEDREKAIVEDKKEPIVEDKKDDEMDVDEPEVVKPKVEVPLDPRKAPENKDIGLHCWIVGTLQSEVDHAYARVEEMIEYAVKEYEAWLELQEEESSEEEEEDVENEAEGKDVVMVGQEEVVKGTEVDVKL